VAPWAIRTGEVPSLGVSWNRPRRRKEETVGNKDKGATKASKKVAQKSLKEKRQSKKTKRAASTGRAE
jgi:hypothetical protein